MNIDFKKVIKLNKKQLLKKCETLDPLWIKVAFVFIAFFLLLQIILLLLLLREVNSNNFIKKSVRIEQSQIPIKRFKEKELKEVTNLSKDRLNIVNQIKKEYEIKEEVVPREQLITNTNTKTNN